ncbi:MAG TPA: MaoC/PaaZ C-terminal domain-containing protein [Steroidobacter sp.]|uniref:MaoC/PaaZ C-terminal domain-containing protein n=1 Tax=Steroidobacter sp. TaxID=1978227 RepID=UPI002EDA6D30
MTQQKYGDDFKPGEIYDAGRITVTETHVVNWAGLTGDFYPLHMDAEYAAQTQFGERLVHGPMIFALAVGRVALAGFGGDSAIAWLGVDNLRMMAPVRIGDTIRVSVEIKEMRTTSDPKKGVGMWHYSVHNQRGEPVMSFDYKMLFHMRG